MANPLNTTLVSNVTSPQQFIPILDQATGGLVLDTFLLGIFLLCLIVFKKSTESLSMGSIALVSSFLTFTISILLWSMEWTGFEVVRIPFVLMLISAMYFLFAQD